MDMDMNIRYNSVTRTFSINHIKISPQLTKLLPMDNLGILSDIETQVKHSYPKFTLDIKVTFNNYPPHKYEEKYILDFIDSGGVKLPTRDDEDDPYIMIYPYKGICLATFFLDTSLKLGWNPCTGRLFVSDDGDYYKSFHIRSHADLIHHIKFRMESEYELLKLEDIKSSEYSKIKDEDSRYLTKITPYIRKLRL